MMIVIHMINRFLYYKL